MARAALIGAILALVVVGVVVALALTGSLPLGATPGTANGPVAVALVLPDAKGTVVVRAIDVYARSGSGWSVRSVAPTASVVVPGTGGSSLSDAYSFGGGDGLAGALRQTGQAVTSWVIVDQSGWNALRAHDPLSITLASSVEVFDGSQLLSFEKGTASVPATQTPELFDGAAFFTTEADRALRQQVGAGLVSSLRSATPGATSFVHSDLTPPVLNAWLGGLGTVRRTSGD